MDVLRGGDDPVVSVGVVADPQYADLDTVTKSKGVNGWHGLSEVRNYRESELHVLRAAVNFEKAGVQHVLQLGDLIDGMNTHNKLDKAGALARMRRALRDTDTDGPCKWQVHHLVGNNEVVNFTRSEMHKWMKLRVIDGGGPSYLAGEAKESPALDKYYYDFQPCQNWRIVVLDTFAISLRGSAVEGGEQAAKQWLLKNNPNCAGLGLHAKSEIGDFLWSPDKPKGWTLDTNLDGTPEFRFLDYNGALGDAQHRWLKEVLQRARLENQHVIVAGHTPCHAEVANKLDSLAWDAPEICQTLAQAGCVIAYLAGHDHHGGYFYDMSSGIHHLTVPSPLIAQRDANTGRFVSPHLVLDLHPDGRIGVRGDGFVRVQPAQKSPPRVWFGEGGEEAASAALRFGFMSAGGGSAAIPIGST